MKYSRRNIRCEVTTPWFSLHEGINQDEKGGAWANRGLVVRSWRARLNNTDIPIPHAFVFGTNNGLPSANVEISAPPDLRMLQPGDFVECLVELLIMHKDADDYYGPNNNLQVDLSINANTWKPILRQAIGNNLSLKVIRGHLKTRLRISEAMITIETQQLRATENLFRYAL